MAQRKIILFIGESLFLKKELIQHSVQDNVCCMFAKTGMRGISEACTRMPDMIFCEAGDKFCNINNISSNVSQNVPHKNIEYIPVDGSNIEIVLRTLNKL